MSDPSLNQASGGDAILSSTGNGRFAPLIVRYTPRTGSHTATLVDAAVSALPGADICDLATQAPDWFDRQRIDAYTRRNYRGQALSDADAASLAGMDAMTAQLMRATHVVLAFPIYNFSVPAAVKAWFDAVVQKGKTWIAGPDGFRGTLSHQQALIIATSGGTYTGAAADDEHATRLAEANFRFMGVARTEIVTASGLNQASTDRAVALGDAADAVTAVIQRWQAAAASSRTAPASAAML